MGLGSVRTRWPDVGVVVVVKRQKQNERPISKDDRGFVLLCVSRLSCEWLAFGSAQRQG